MKMSYQKQVQNREVAKTKDPDWLRVIREKAEVRFEEVGFPTRKMEAWKYMNLEEVLKTPFDTEGSESATSKRDLEKYFLHENEVSARMVLMNGEYCSDLSSFGVIPKEGRVESLQKVLKSNKASLETYFAKDIADENDPFATINTFSFSDGVLLHVPKNTAFEKPVHVFLASYATEKRPTVSYPRILVVMDSGSKAELVIDQVDLGEGLSLSNTVAEVSLAPNSTLMVTHVERHGPNATQLLSLRAHLEKDCHFEMNSFSTGGRSSRNDVQVHLHGENAYCELSGLAVLDKKSQVFQHAAVHHRVEHGTSRQIYKNILTDKSQAEFNSLAHVLRGANHSDSEQMDRNLLLSEDARVYSRPQLKIDADDVKCNHGAATGQLEDKELFYLRSRGIAEDEARFVLTYGFAEEVLEKIHPPTLRHQVELSVRNQIRKMVRK